MFQPALPRESKEERAGTDKRLVKGGEVGRRMGHQRVDELLLSPGPLDERARKRPVATHTALRDTLRHAPSAFAAPLTGQGG